MNAPDAGSSRLEHEFAEQPDAVARLLEGAPAVLRPWLAGLPADLPLLLIARGSSDNAALYGRYALALRSGRDALLALPSITTLHGRPPARRAAAVAISQSGASPDLVEVLAAAGEPSLAITNDVTSPLAAAAGTVVDLAAGPERAVAATKSFTASLAALALLAAIDGDDRDAERELAAVPDAVRAAVATDVPSEAVSLLRGVDRIVVTGRGVHLATAREVALKLQELTGSLVEALSPADLAHGPIRAVGPGVAVVAVAPSGEEQGSVAEAIERARERGAPAIAITDDGADLPTHEATLTLPVRLPAWLSPISAVVLGQRLAIEVTRARGLDPDAPPGLTKVTRTR